MSFLRNHRSVLQAGGVYAAGGWLAYEIIDEVGRLAGLPEWVSVATLLLLVLGFPAILLTAYVQSRVPPAVPEDHRQLDPTLHPEFEQFQRPGAGALAHTVTWRRTLGIGGALFVLLALGTTGFMTARTSGIGPFGTLFAQGVLDADDVILMADFSSSRDPALGRAVAEALRIDLVQSNAIRVADAKQVREALERMQRDPADGLPPDVALMVAEREGIRAVIRGEVSALGNGFQLLAELVSHDGAVLDAFRETARDSTQLIDAVDRMSNRMRARIGESLKTIRGSPSLSRVSTRSLPALRRYSEGVEVGRTSGDIFRSVELYEQAIALDSTFAMAWHALGINLSNAAVRRDDMLHAFRRAYELRDRLPERERLRAVAMYESQITGNLRASADAYRSLLAIDAGDGAARNNLALTLRMLRRNEEAEALLAPLPPEQRLPAEWVNLLHAQYDQGRLAEAQATIAGMQRHMPEHLNTAGMTFLMLMAQDQRAEAESLLVTLLGQVRGNAAAQLVGASQLALVYALSGRLDEALVSMEGSAAAAARFGLEDVPFEFRLTAASALALITRDGPRSRALLDRALAEHDRAALPPHSRRYLDAAVVRAVSGDFQAAQRELDAFRREVPPEDRNASPAELPLMEATVQLLRGDAAAVLATLRPVAATDECTICPLPVMAQAFELLGQQDSAVTYYERYLDTPYLARLGTDVLWRANVLERVGALHEARGNREQALRRYAELTLLWARADAALQPRVDAVRRRIAALQGAG
jgi:eukaryotic-like serine/threonine-protein kinase